MGMILFYIVCGLIMYYDPKNKDLREKIKKELKEVEE